MIGTPKGKSLPDGVLTPAHDPLSLLGAQQKFAPQLAANYAPRNFDVGAIGVLARADDHGRGLTSVANKASIVNILNIPRFLVVYQNPMAMQPRMTRRIISKTIPLPGGS